MNKKNIIISLSVIILALMITFIYLSSLKKSTIKIDKNLNRQEIAEILHNHKIIDEKGASDFPIIWAQMQWLAFGTNVLEVLSKKYNWSQREQEVFLTSTTKFINPALDPLFPLYIEGEYTFSKDLNTVPKVANEFIIKIKSKYTEKETLNAFIENNISDEVLENIVKFINREQELLPDLAPLPPQDLVIEESNNNVYLRFSTIYYNTGRGVLELQADKNTKGIRKDIERDVYQIIYHEDGTTREKIAGNFLWHQEHLHYHFKDFAIYDLEAVSVEGIVPDLSGVMMKSTFCIRDVSKVDIDIPNKTEARYQICGKEKQGISVGWGDTYFYTYPDQALNITDLPSGTYKLSFIINPKDRFDEITKDNNISSVVINLDMDKKTFKIIEESPKEYPSIEHVYPTQDCPVCTL